jgi:photosystem II stability/assembly factor-like uncharacterized protein
MRPIFAALALAAALAAPVRAADLRFPDDAALRAVQFVDENEGWAVGDAGVIWHTIDGGQTWERQPTGVRASLRGLHFLNPFTGWVVGREELPQGGSVGVVLATRDGGLKWQRLCIQGLPGLQRVHFFDDKTGIAIGEGTDQYPTGVFTTADGGRNWKPMPGPRCPAWLAADFTDPQNGALAGAWGRLATLRQGVLGAAEVDTLSGRSVRDLRLVGNRAIAVGEGGLVLVSSNSAGLRWGFADLASVFKPETLACLDFHAVACRGEHIWVAGRPGSLVLHSADHGLTWQTASTGRNVPVHGLFFLNEQRGWAVGELGTILGTADGGKTWTVQREGGQRSAALFVHARAGGVPFETIALLGGDDGYLTTALQVTAADPASAPPAASGAPQRLTAAMRLAAGAAGETLWQFPLPQHLGRAEPRELIGAWDKLHGDRAADQILRQLVLALRMWRPEVVVTDGKVPDSPIDELIAEAVEEAYKRAADPAAFPEQLAQLGLKPWQVKKLYARCADAAGAPVVCDLTEAKQRLQSTPRDFAAPSLALCDETPASQACFHLLAASINGAANHRGLMDGIDLGAGGTARRPREPLEDLNPDIEKGIRARRNLQALAETPIANLTEPDRLLAQIGPALAGMSDDQGAPAAFAIASQFARNGQWTLAREAFLLLVDRYPAHPLAADGYRWLLRYSSSSEARRRQELGQFIAVTEATVRDGTPQQNGPIRTSAEGVEKRQLTLLGDLAEARRWYQGCLQVEPRLASFGGVFSDDPAVQFCLQAARRNLGEFAAANEWYKQFAADHRDGPWRDAAVAELWLANRNGAPPKPLALCRQSDTRPLLDGQFDDACWQGVVPLKLKNAVGDTVKDYPTEAWLAFDNDFLYVALRCKHPADRYVEPVKKRKRDEDLHAFDRVSILLDLDRDYSTYYRLEIDQRGCLCEDCWGDRTWNPRWFVAVRSDPTGWQIEAAIPLAELTGEPVTLNRTWACNVVRILPGRGVQAWSVPADVQPRPEGMGLLMFTADPAKAGKAAAVTPKLPTVVPGTGQ